MNPLLQRIAAGMSANAFGQGVTILIQLGSLPFFLSQWDAARYGAWLLLSAVPAYLLMADVGMVTAAGNRMTMAMGAGRLDEARTSFHSATAFMAVVCAGLAVTAVPLVLWAPLPGPIDADSTSALALLVLSVLITFWGGLVEALFRATGRYALGTTLANVIRLGEWLGSIVGLYAIGSFAAVALGGLVVRLSGLAVIVAWSRRDAQGLDWGLSAARRAEIRSMVAPAAWFIVFPLAQATSFQGTTLLVGHVLGPVAVAVFNTHRTLTRVSVQLTSIFCHALAPELSRLHGAASPQKLRDFYRKAWGTGLVAALLANAALAVCGGWLLEHWTRGAIAFDGHLFTAMLLTSLVACAWHVPRMLLLSTNRHGPLAFWYATSAAAGLALAAWAVGWAGLVGVAWSLLAAELVVAVVGSSMAQSAVSSSALPALASHP